MHLNIFVAIATKAVVTWGKNLSLKNSRNSKKTTTTTMLPAQLRCYTVNFPDGLDTIIHCVIIRWFALQFKQERN